MLNANAIFLANIRIAREQSSLYDFLALSDSAPSDFTDILRSQIVYSVSAFDKLLHDLVRIGMVQTYLGRRSPTSKFKSEVITTELHFALLSATLPPAEVLFDQYVVKKLAISAFQDPVKVADGLSLIWPEAHKWYAIANSMGKTEQNVTTTLKLISIRRNAIVHQADTDPFTNAKN